MSVYQQYASGEAQYLKANPESFAKNPHQTNEPASNDNEDGIIIFPLSGRLELTKNSEFRSKSTEEWINIFPNAAYFCGYDESLFGHFVMAVYENPSTEKICTLSITKFGVTLYHDLILNQQSRFYPSCENLLPIHRESKVRKALAITNLKNYNKLVNHPGDFQINKRWDETNAGYLASKMNLLIDKRPNEFGCKLLQMGLIQNHYLKSYLFDIVYDNSLTDPKIVEDNNKLVYLLGDQLDQLFDPLLEYSPEKLETSYNTPNSANYDKPILSGNEKISAITQELLQIQTNFTMGLVELLQNFIIPLRIHILSNNVPPKNGSNPTDSNISSGISKLNQIFPPTIDEITRINCVLHDSLTKAKPFGYIEIIKVFGMILPYFYKPFIRHEANLKNFKSRFNKFYSKYENKVFGNGNINRNGFSKNYIDSIITGSLLELPKLKLILHRLYDNINTQFKLKSYDRSQEELSTIDYYYNTAINIIDAFGGEDNEVSQQYELDNKGHERANSRQRVFTPTGKILTELASNWPPELQYGWLNRKVIGIFELKNVKPRNEFFHDSEILIIFSDTLLFLRIVDDNYYIKENINEGFSLLSIPDVLMHSLVNEKPLPNLSQFPSMEVSHWSFINDTEVTTYKSFSFTTSSEENFLRFFDYTGNGFKGDFTNEICKNYEILNNENKNVASGNDIIELINKGKILNKNQPFHLFRSTANDLHVYSTAHSALSYDNEQVKSRIILLLNLSQEMVNHYFELNPHLCLVFTACFTYERDIQLIAFSRGGVVEANVVGPESQFQTNLIRLLSDLLNASFNSFTSVTELMIRSNHVDLEYYLLQYQRFNSYENREKMKHRINSEGSKNKRKKNKLSSEQSDTAFDLGDLVQPESYQAEIHQAEVDQKEEANMDIKDSTGHSNHILEEAPDERLDHNSKTMKSKPKRRSFIKRLFSGFKKTSKDSDIPQLNQETKREQTINNETPDIDKRASKKYKELYRPHPKLYESETIENEPKDLHQQVNSDANLQPKNEHNANGNQESLEMEPELAKDQYNAMYSHHNDSMELQTVHHYKQDTEQIPDEDQQPNTQELPEINSGTRQGAGQVDRVHEPESSKIPFKELYDTSEENISYKNEGLREPALNVNTSEKQMPKEEETKPAPEQNFQQESMKLQPQNPIQHNLPVRNQPSNAKTQADAITQAQLLFRKARQQTANVQDIQQGNPNQPHQPCQSSQPSQRYQPKPIMDPKYTKQEPNEADNVHQDNRIPSLDVNSQFHFPPEPPVNNDSQANKENGPSEDKITNKNDFSIKDVTESQFYPELISQIILDEDDANWVPVSRNSSSSSISPAQSEYMTSNDIQRENIGQDYHYDTSLNSRGDANFASKIRDVSAADSYRSQVVFFNDQIQQNIQDFIKNDESVQSLTPSQYADQFSREIDMNFSSQGIKQSAQDNNQEQGKEQGPGPGLGPELRKKPIDSIYNKSINFGLKVDNKHQYNATEAIPQIKDDSKEVAKRYSGFTNTSSEDEYYSLDEYPGSPIKTKSNSHSPTLPVTPITPNNNQGSFSSENTIINELLQEENGQNQYTAKPVRSTRNDSVTTATNMETDMQESFKPMNNDIYIHQLDSMAYLSDVLNGTVKFDD